MTVINESVHTGEWLISEADGQRSRSLVTVTVAGGVALPTGTTLGKITATGKYVKANNGASDGSQVTVAVLLNDIPGVNGDYPNQVVIDTDAEVIASLLNNRAGLASGEAAELLAVGIKAR